ncbi:transporter substrate-binding domain-containing protein [Bacillaceae bacterium W0354]
MNKKLLGIIFSVLLVVVLAACGTLDQKGEENDKDIENTSGSSDQEKNQDKSDEKKVLTLGTSADFPPFESYDESGEIVGFDIDIAKAIAEELGLELKVDDMDFNGLIGALQTNRVDMVMAGMSATEERKENVDFSSAYHYSGEMFISKKDSDVTELEHIAGKTVGVQLGTIQEEGAYKIQEEIDFEIKLIDDATTLIQELLTGRIDIAYMDKTVAEGYIEAQDLAGFDDPTTSTPGMAVAFPKDSEFVEEVSAVIDQLIESGKIEELEEKWGLND